MGGFMSSSFSPQRERPKAGISTWIVGAIALLFLILGAVTGGLAGVLVLLALFLFFTGLYTLIFGRPSWLRLPSRKWGGAALGSGFVVLIVGSVLLPPSADVAETSLAESTPTPTASQSPTPSSTPSATPSKSSIPTESPSPSPSPTPSPTPPTPAALPVGPFGSCAEAAELGIYNMPEDSPVYSADFDVDRDGVACENADIAYDPALVGESPQPVAPAPVEPLPVAPAPGPPAPAPAVPAIPAPVVPDPAPAPAAPYYANCDAVKAAGAAPIRAGDPGWQPKFDGNDDDGIGCES